MHGLIDFDFDEFFKFSNISTHRGHKFNSAVPVAKCNFFHLELCQLGIHHQMMLLRGVVWCGVVWCGVAWQSVVWVWVCGGMAKRGVVWGGVVWHGMAWRGCGVVWCGMEWRCLAWRHVETQHHLTSNDITLYHIASRHITSMTSIGDLLSIRLNYGLTKFQLLTEIEFLVTNTVYPEGTKLDPQTFIRNFIPFKRYLKIYREVNYLVYSFVVQRYTVLLPRPNFKP